MNPPTAESGPTPFDRASLRSQLDTLAAGGFRCLRRWRLSVALRDAVKWAPLWLAAGPLALVVAQAIALMTGSALPPITLGLLITTAVAGMILYIVVRVVATYAAFHPRRATALALYDRALDSKDRLVTADEFLGLPSLEAQTAEGAFMRAAISDAAEPARKGLTTTLQPLPVPAWKIQAASWSGIPAAALVIFLSWLGLSSLTPANTNSGKPAAIVADVGSANKPADDAKNNPRRAMARMAAPSDPTAAEDKSPSANKPTRRKTKKEKNMDGQPGSGGGSHANTSNAATQTAGLSPSQRSAPKAKKPEVKNEDQEEERDEKESKKRKPKKQDTGQMALDANSGQGKSSSSSSSLNPFETPEEADKTGQPLKGEAEDEGAEDEDEQEKSGGVTKPMGDTKQPPVDRNLSTRPPGDSDQPQNGRGGPGPVKKTRGVPSMILGIPVPDRVPGVPGPGRSKVSQEFTRPKEEAHPALDAQTYLERAGVVGHIEQPDLLPWRREIIENYFLSLRQKTDATTDPTDR